MTTPIAPTASTADREMVITRLVKAPRALVWDAWTDPKHMAHWWGPNGFSTTMQEVNVKPGGTWKFIMHGPDGTDYPNVIVFQEIVKPERLEYTHGGDDQGLANFNTTITFEDQDGHTLITMKALYPTKQMRDETVEKYGALEGGKQHLERLEFYLGWMTATKPAFELNFTRLIKTPRERVYAAWADPNQMKEWFAPKPFILVVKQMDFRPGGRYRMAMKGPDGSEFPFAGTYLDITPPEKLRWTGAFSTGPADQLETMITFEAEGPHTRLHARQTFHIMTPEIEMALKGANQGWNMTLDQLEAHLAKG